MRYLVIFFTFALLPHITAAQSITHSQEELDAQKLFLELRCMVCDGQPLAGSDAELAQNMRSLIREKLAAGESPDNVKAFMVSRYGEEILLEPEINAHTLPLWFLPVILLIMGGLCTFLLLRKQTHS